MNQIKFLSTSVNTTFVVKVHIGHAQLGGQCFVLVEVKLKGDVIE